jgi:serine/threonine protein kinase
MDEHLGAIANGELLSNRYKIIKFLGAGGFGITYKAIDLRTEMKVAIKEYFPSNLVYRLDNSKEIAINSSMDKKTFDWGLSSFIKEAQILANLNHKNIVPIDDFFEENNTAYLVMPYIIGIDLKKYVDKIRDFDEEKIYNIIIPILEGLKEAHNCGILHRDIKPENILICKNKEPLLIDFGAAKDTIGKRTNTSKIIVSPPFAPMEQYGNTLPNDKYTDIYAVGMVIYSIMTQKNPREIPTAVDRGINKKLEKLEFNKSIKKKYTKTLINATQKAIEVKYQNRPQDVDKMIELMLESINTTPWMLMIITTLLSATITFFILQILKVQL